MKEILEVLPNHIEHDILTITSSLEDLEEIRLRINKSVELVFHSHSYFLDKHFFTEQDAKEFLGKISQHSVYRMEEELRNGYITIHGGHRIGISGKVTLTNGQVKAITHISSFNIRVAKEHKGTAKAIIPYVYNKQSEKMFNTMMIGAPKSGKTTLLRDLIRSISDGLYGIKSARVSLIDERSEIAAPFEGVPQHDVGRRTDVMADCPKAEGMMMMIRSMSPEVLVVDEIGDEKDVKSLKEAVHAGVQVICSIHGYSLEEIRKRPSLAPLFQDHVFQRYILLDHLQSPGKIERVYGETFDSLTNNIRGNRYEMDRSHSDTVHVHVGRNRYR
ncbi:stage III sporulation protein AA [Tenuibacillus multivorans]|uniref:Stage III sporulation protein AA n=1 Tax=Tenuibacillus multivorans TaxID=237069 RepID=A0A1G9Z830_9BACI|nr:stage III sporulation protein AA [Tenuibacillus multivorans]GEL77360.1 stage III sporulation protein AA [Tenuibacillus multivorans]SDN17470.1 stage III sporulation protein AA [Tenuibacillus multivorans]